MAVSRSGKSPSFDGTSRRRLPEKIGKVVETKGVGS